MASFFRRKSAKDVDGEPEEFFPTVPKIQYEGPESTNPLAFRFYNASAKYRRCQHAGACP